MNARMNGTRDSSKGFARKPYAGVDLLTGFLSSYVQDASTAMVQIFAWLHLIRDFRHGMRNCVDLYNPYVPISIYLSFTDLKFSG